jgi:twitching motility protein PilT
LDRIPNLLRRTVEMNGSDLHIKAGAKPYVRVYGELILLEDEEVFSPETSRSEIFSVISDAQRKRFEKELELDFAYAIEGVARFRGNIYQQRNVVQAAFRVIPLQIESIDDLRLPPVVKTFCERPRGLVLVTGPAGSGKSTTQAACIDYINHREPCHIVTVEDPVEFIHDDDKAFINQRELDVDTLSFANALKYVLRQDPDVILVGEMRDLDTIQLAITASETGHLVFGTLHTVDAVQTVDRIIDVFPIHQQQQVRMQLSVNLVGVVSQTLIKRADGRGRVAAFETLNAVGAVRNLIRENKTYQISSIVQTGMRLGMQTLDQSLANLVREQVATLEDAAAKAKDPGEFQRLIELG